MKITRENYEVWFTDWIDNKLSDSQLEELDDFLRLNPDLVDEFNEPERMILKPGREDYTGKSKLRRSPSDIPSDQFDILATAYFENDLTEEQRSEIDQVIINDPEKKKAFELAGKIKLLPPEMTFPYKSKLLRTTVTAKIIRLSFAGLAAAATITILLTMPVFKPRLLPENITASTAGDTLYIKRSAEIKPVIRKNEDRFFTKVLPVRENAEPVTGNIAEVIDNDTMAGHRSEGISIEKVSTGQAQLSSLFLEKDKLAASSIALVSIDEESDDRSNLRKFIAFNFRKKILKEEVPGDNALKGYEIAEAGVSGLNKLLGWDMAITRNTDESGDLKSIYFSSRMLKFNTPVKKSENGE